MAYESREYDATTLYEADFSATPLFDLDQVFILMTRSKKISTYVIAGSVEAGHKHARARLRAVPSGNIDAPAR